MKAYILLLAFTGYIHLNANADILSEPTISINERVFLNTDRKVYIAGENLLYNLYLLDNNTKALAKYPSIGYVVLRGKNGVIIGKSQVKIKEGKAAGAIYLSDTLRSGYYQVVAYTNFMRNGSPRIFFKSQVLIANRFDKDFFELITAANADSISQSSYPRNASGLSKLTLTVDKNVFFQREKVTVNFSLNDIQLAALSVSVVEKNPIEQQTNQEFAIADKSNNDIAIENVDNPGFVAEDKNAELSGRLTNETGHPMAFQVLYLSSPDTINNFKYTVTNSNGYFRFPLSDYFNGKDLFIKIKPKDGESFTPKFEIDSKFRFEGKIITEPWIIDSTVINYLRKSQQIVRIQKSFSLIQSQYSPLKYPAPVPLLYKIPDYKVYPADYVELRDFIEIAREIVPPLKVRKRDMVYFAEIMDYQKRMFLQPKPLIFFDGVLIDDISQVISYGTRDIKKVEVISSEWIIDHQVLEGVLSITSNNNLWKGINLNTNNEKIKAENYYQIPNLYQPNYSIVDPKTREPDFRQLLYWNPNLQIPAGSSGKFEFYTSDHAASYIIKVFGISNKGELVEATGEIEVKEKN